MSEPFTAPKLRPFSRSEVRAIDALAAKSYSMPTLILMENAGRGAAEWLLSRLKPGEKVLILYGPGNNGGDGGVVARHLDLRAIDVKVVGFSDPTELKGDAALQWSILEKSGLAPFALNSAEPLRTLLNEADWVVDALLGSGLTRPVEGLLRDVIDMVNRSRKPVVAVDIPSGLDADTGQPLGLAIRAVATLTFVAPKIGFDQTGAIENLGEVVVISIGAPRALLRPYEVD